MQRLRRSVSTGSTAAVEADRFLDLWILGVAADVATREIDIGVDAGPAAVATSSIATQELQSGT